MFGDNTNQQATTDNVINPALPPVGMGAPVTTNDTPFPSFTPPVTDMTTDDAASAPVTDTPALPDFNSFPADATVADEPTDAPTPDNALNAAAPAVLANSSDDETDDSEDETDNTASDDDATISASTAPLSKDLEELVNIKQQALEQLSPLVGQLDQSPEERFRTTMMMIQASDNQELVKQAFSAAQDIPDDKARAQALLDVINEINYFTSQSKTDA